MKTYEPRRNNACPNGLHPDYDPAKDPSQNECTCPWLIIQSSSPVQHLTSWNRRETENVIREMDRGYFDPPGYPRRTGSMFLSPAMQRLLDVAEKEPVAAALTLLAGSGSGLPPFDAIAWDAEDAVLSVRIGGGGWWHLFLGTSNVEAVTNHDDAHAAGANPVLLWADHPDTDRETALPKLNAAWHHEQCACDLNNPQQQAGCQRADEFSAAYLPEEASGDVYAEDILNFDGTPVLPSGTPIFAETAAAVDEMTETEKRLHTNPELVEQIKQTINDPSYRVRGERPLPRRVPKVPSDIAEAGHGDYCTCDLNLRYTCPACRTAQADACTCAIRGSGPDTYACPEHPACGTCGGPLVYDTMVGDTPTHTCRPDLY